MASLDAKTGIPDHQLDPKLLMWDIHRRVNLDALPPERVVVRFDFRGEPATMRCPRYWWLVLERREIVGGACVTEEVWPGQRVSRAS